MSAYLLVSLDIEVADGFKNYQRAVMRTFKIGEGRVLAAARGERVEGDEPRAWNVIVEFPSMEKARSWYESEEYQRVIALRSASAPGANVMHPSMRIARLVPRSSFFGITRCPVA